MHKRGWHLPCTFSVSRPLCLLSKKLRELHDSSNEGSLPSLEFVLAELEFLIENCWPEAASSRNDFCWFIILDGTIMSFQSSTLNDDNCCDDFLGLLPADLVPKDDTARLPCLAELLRGNTNSSSSLQPSKNIKWLYYIILHIKVGFSDSKLPLRILNTVWPSSNYLYMYCLFSVSFVILHMWLPLMLIHCQ